jgi:hypothetical protein
LKSGKKKNSALPLAKLGALPKVANAKVCGSRETDSYDQFLDNLGVPKNTFGNMFDGTIIVFANINMFLGCMDLRCNVLLTSFS